MARADIWLRQGGEFGRSVSLATVPHILIAFGVSALLFWLGGRSRRRVAAFLICLLLAVVMCLNLQFILGTNIQPDHWLTRVFWLSVGFGWVGVVVWGGQRIAATSPFARRILVVGLLLFCIIQFPRALHGQMLFAEQHTATYSLPRDEFVLWQNLNAVLGRDAVVATPSFQTASYIPLLTSARLYVPRALNTPAPEEEVLDRAFRLWRSVGMTPQAVGDLLEPKKTCKHMPHGMGTGWEFGCSLALRMHRMRQAWHSAPRICQSSTRLRGNA